MDSAKRIAYRFSTSMAYLLKQLIRAVGCPQKALLTLHWERPHLCCGILALGLKISWVENKSPIHSPGVCAEKTKVSQVWVNDSLVGQMTSNSLLTTTLLELIKLSSDR